VLVKKKGKGGKKKNKQNNKQQQILLDVDMLNDFNMLQIEAPTTTARVPDTIQALKDKKVWYSEQPRPEKRIVRETTTESENKTDDKKKGNKKEKKAYNADDMDFPTLAGFVPQSTVVNGIAEGVSDVDAIKGQSA